MIRINQIKLSIKDSESNIDKKIRKLLKLNDKTVFEYTIVKKSIDARRKDQLMYIYSVDVILKDIDEFSLLKKINNNNIMLTNKIKYVFPEIGNINQRIIIVGSGL